MIFSPFASSVISVQMPIGSSPSCCREHRRHRAVDVRAHRRGECASGDDVGPCVQHSENGGVTLDCHRRQSFYRRASRSGFPRSAGKDLRRAGGFAALSVPLVPQSDREWSERIIQPGNRIQVSPTRGLRCARRYPSRSLLGPIASDRPSTFTCEISRIELANNGPSPSSSVSSMRCWRPGAVPWGQCVFHVRGKNAPRRMRT